MKSHSEAITTARCVSLDRNEPRPATPEVVLQELLELLEDYGPTWYTEEIHNRAVAVLTQACR
jgi:hypothetical protein